LYPPVDIKKFKSRKKENLIIYVGRFSSLTQAKRQDVLVDTFKKLHDEGVRNWRLVLAGGVEVGVDEKLAQLRESAKGYPIRIMESPSFKELVDLYGKAKIFWSAAGFEIDENKEPAKMEHFGITVVEAMASKAIPIVYSGGGHKEIIDNGKNGFLWSGTDELLNLTKNTISKYTSLNKVARTGFENCKNYSYENFEKELLSLL
jgi:glycosyltransferase involved in cell wall biosynthesis